jgi:hypothetical protein
MVMNYQDGSIGIDADHLSIRGYYFPGTVKRIPLAALRSVQRVPMRQLRGRGRIWGTSNPRYWANFDPRRPAKMVAFVVDAGKAVKPFVTPDDPDRFEQAMRHHGIRVLDRKKAPLV